MKKCTKQCNIKNIIILGSPIFLVSIILWLAFYPAVMTADSLSEWNQIQMGTFSDWHPVVYTWLIMMTTKIWHSPAAMALFQIIVMSSFIGYSLSIFTRYGVSLKKLFIISVVFSIFPYIPLMTICIWKDIIYAVFISFLTLLLIRICIEGEKLLSKRIFYFELFLAVTGTILFRHNGIVPGFITLILLIMLIKKYRKRLLIVFTSVVLVFVVLMGPVYKILNVEPTSKSEAFCIMMQSLGRIARYDSDSISEDDKKSMNEILPFEKWGSNYNENVADPIKFDKEFNSEIINEDPIGFMKLWFSVIKSSPKEALKAYAHSTKVIWNPITGHVNNCVAYPIEYNKYNLKSEMKFPSITKPINEFYYYLSCTYGNFYRNLLWKPAIPMYIFIGIIIFLSIRNKDKKYYLIMVPMLFNVLSLAISIPAQDFRYLFSNYIILMITIPIIYLKKKTTKAY